MFPLITKKSLLGTFNRPPNSSQDVLTSIEGSISLAYDTNIQNILITGDFNLDVLKSSFNKRYLTCVNISVYSNSSSSIIDLLFTSNINSIVFSDVGEPILDQNIRFHCPVYCVLIFDKCITPIYTLRDVCHNRL